MADPEIFNFGVGVATKVCNFPSEGGRERGAEGQKIHFCLNRSTKEG